MKHRVISLILAFVLAVGLSVLPVRAAEGDWVYTHIKGGLRLDGYLGEETEITLPDTLAGQPVIEIGEGCFQNSMLTEVTIPHGIRVIGKEAFSGSQNLKKVHLGGSVNVIGERAFANTGLTKMDIPGCVRSIGKEAFLECLRLFNVVIDGGVEDWSTGIGADIGSGSVKMEEGVKSIGDRAFYGCKNLTKMFVPASVTQIGDQAMGYTNAGKQNYQITGYTGTAAQNYASNHGLTFKTLENQNADIGVCGAGVQWSFDRDSGVLTVSGAGRMYDYAAAECLPWYAMREQITAAVVEAGVTSVGDFAFSGSSVAQVTLPLSLKWVGSRAFADCAALAELTFPGDAPTFAGDAFENTTLTACYPGFNSTWTRDVRQNYGGTVTWKAPDVPHEHRYEAVVTEPTCTEDGYTIYTCICGDSYVDNETAARGHDFVNGACSRCDAVLKSVFTDVPAGRFYFDPVSWAVSKGITTGTTATTFDPNGMCMRAVVVTFLWRAAGKPEPTSTYNPFTDVKESDYFYKAVLWAAEKGITSGISANEFGPRVLCNRAQVVTFLWRAQGKPASTAAVAFDDVQSGRFYTTAVAWAVEKGITNGISATTFGVDTVCNRAQVVTFLYRTLAGQNG